MSAKQINYRTVFFVSDRTGITAEKTGRSLLTQFPGLSFKARRLSFLEVETIDSALAQFDEAMETDGARPIVFATFAEVGMVARLQGHNACVIDLYSSHTLELENELLVDATHKVGLTHGKGKDPDSYTNYHRHMDAINYTVDHDDGLKLSLKTLGLADVVLLGVSRSGKTPTCMYLAIQYSLRAANVPLTDDYFSPVPRLPPVVREYQRKNKGRLIGLTLDPKELSRLRMRRKPDAPKYSSIDACKREVVLAEQLYEENGIPVINTTMASVPEISVKILDYLPFGGV